MAKISGSFSILLVLALLVLMVPAAVLLGPLATVVEAANVTEELTASFVLNTVSTNGAWYNFNWGDGGSAPWRGEQFTRQGVDQSAARANSGFREYSNYSGTISGGMSGTLRMKFNMWCFNLTYPYTPVYNVSGTYFGTMFGRGEVTTASGAFPFVMIADLDGARNFTGALGKGLMMSYNETGIYANRQISGEFDITITNASYYSGTMTMRNYPTEEIVAQGWTNASNSGADGQVKEDTRDTVAEGLDLVYFNSFRGDYHTESSGYGDAGLEEATRGEEGSQHIQVSASLGTGGLAANSRNNFVDAGRVLLNAQLEGVVTTRVYLNDTYAATGNDGSLHGWLYQTLTLDMPYTSAGAGTWVNQNGFMMCNFAGANLSTEDYVGIETQGNQIMSFKAALSGPYDAHSNTSSWDLRPTPKPLACNSSNGTAGTTMNVTISGRYFLRHSSFINGSTISFGPGITVNGWTVGNTSPIENTVTVNISIAANATEGYRDVNLTACFAYGKASATNQTGTLANGFYVTVPATTATINGTVFEANADPVSGADVVLKCGGSTVNTTTTNATGYYNFTVNATCNYTVNVTKGGLTYAQKWANITALGQKITVDFKGLDAPYPKAPSSLYCLKCSNLWLYGDSYPAGFKLDAQRVSDILYAWTHPTA